MAISHRVNLGGIKGLERLQERVSLIPQELAMWADEYRLAHGQAWEQVKFGTGAVLFRGEEVWPAPADQYTRKTDSETVPAWGGVQRLDKKGNVKGRKRPSGKRVTSESTMMADTARMRSGFLTPRFERDGFRVTFDGSTEGYGQYQNRRRHFAFFARVDVERLVDRMKRLFTRG